MKKLSQFALQAISLTSFLVLWQLVIVAGIIPNYLVPTPVQVVFALVKDFQLLMTHTGITLLESLVGLAIGVLIGFALAVLMDFFKTLDKLLSPLVTISQTISSALAGLWPFAKDCSCGYFNVFPYYRGIELGI